MDQPPKPVFEGFDFPPAMGTALAVAQRVE
jgi:hypothetical protein